METKEPTLAQPSREYVQSYLDNQRAVPSQQSYHARSPRSVANSRRHHTPANSDAALAATPLLSQQTSRGSPRHPSTPGAASRNTRAVMPRALKAFYPLEEKCPEHYYPKLREVNPRKLALVRSSLVGFSLLQVGVAYWLYDTAPLHETTYNIFAEASTVLCAAAALCGVAGVGLSSRALLLMSYVTQIWSLSNVCTFLVMHLADHEQETTACRMMELGDLPGAEAGARLACGGAADETHRMVVRAMGALLALLWATSFLGRTYSEMLQDAANDADDRALVDFVWARRRETWLQLQKFEGTVTTQFVELRSGLMN